MESVTACLDGQNCFIAGTLILTADGYKNIEDVQAGDMVIATDPETGETAEKKVIETYIRQTNELIYIWVNGEEIITTPTHPFYVPEIGWTDAVDLRAGDTLVLVNGQYVIIEKTQHEILEDPVTVYNFQVADFHTYYAGEQSVLVHNAKYKRPYSHLTDGPNVGEGKQFTAAQKNKMLQENMKRNGGVVKSDAPDDFYEVLSKPKKSIKGETPDPSEWQFDHIIPLSKGGTNSYSNCQIVSRKYNRLKSNN